MASRTEEERSAVESRAASREEGSGPRRAVPLEEWATRCAAAERSERREEKRRGDRDRDRESREQRVEGHSTEQSRAQDSREHKSAVVVAAAREE